MDLRVAEASHLPSPRWHASRSEGSQVKHRNPRVPAAHPSSSWNCFALLLLVGSCSCVVQASHSLGEDPFGSATRPIRSGGAAGPKQWVPDRSSRERQLFELPRIIVHVLILLLRALIPMVWAHLSDLWIGRQRPDHDIPTQAVRR